MAKVITSMLKFPPEQAQKVLEKEDSKMMVSIFFVSWIQSQEQYSSFILTKDRILHYNLHCIWHQQFCVNGFDMRSSTALVTVSLWTVFMGFCCCCWRGGLPRIWRTPSLCISVVLYVSARLLKVGFCMSGCVWAWLKLKHMRESENMPET